MRNFCSKFQLPFRKKQCAQALLSIALLCIGFFSPAEKEKNQEEFWKETSLSQNTLQEIFKKCEKSPQFWFACKNASSALAKHIGKSSASLGIHSTTNFSTLFQKIKKEYYQKNIPNSALAAAWNAYLQTFDPHAKIAPASWEEEQASRSMQSYAGIGIQTQNYDERFRISELVINSPAHRAGLRKGDILLSINGQNTENIARENLFKKISPNEEIASIEIQRDKQKFTVKLKAEKLNLPLLVTKIIPHQETGDKIGWIFIRHFNKKNICNDVRKSIFSLENSGVQGFILDLRSNPGGLVKEAQCISSLFLGKNKLWASFQKIDNPLPMLTHSIHKNSLGERGDFTLYTQETQITKLPVLTLINENTASAAEILAASLQDHSRSLVIGKRSFGKGLMQSVYMPWNNSSLLLTKTTHKIFRPDGTSLQFQGVIPDLAQNNEEPLSIPLLREQDLHTTMRINHKSSSKN